MGIELMEKMRAVRPAGGDHFTGWGMERFLEPCAPAPTGIFQALN
jgi:hypothetical protein